MVKARTAVVSAVLAAALGMNGCRVETRGSGKDGGVKVATPFGGLQVRTDDSVQASVGLPVYPGAQLVKKDGSGESGAADVNLSFGRFQLRVKAVEFRTGDDPAKVKAFYLDALRRYGDVLECSGHRAVGKTVRTAEGLTCEEGKGGHVATGDVSSDLQLKAGSEHHEHVVGIEEEGAGTKFGLVALDLPEGLPVDGGGTDARQ